MRVRRTLKDSGLAASVLLARTKVLPVSLRPSFPSAMCPLLFGPLPNGLEPVRNRSSHREVIVVAAITSKCTSELLRSTRGYRSRKLLGKTALTAAMLGLARKSGFDGHWIWQLPDDTSKGLGMDYQMRIRQARALAWWNLDRRLQRGTGISVELGCSGGSGEPWRLAFGRAQELGQDETEAVEKRGLGGVGDAAQADLTVEGGRQNHAAAPQLSETSS
jgi:hypothetical protein